MNTLNYAKTLGLVDTITVERDLNSKINSQPFQYLLVLDFEATCWDGKDSYKRPNEIIEFSVVLYNISKTEIVSEFQQYVMPTEVQKLSQFCKKLTNITQEQVDNGVPLGTCLMLFTKWLREHIDNLQLSFPGNLSNSNSKIVVFVTWSDWDLKLCLPKECKRKRIKKPQFFNMWVDLRALYMEHYSRRPKGLNGALTEVGLYFIGTEHCGLDDARNTAKLASQMISDGVLLRITKDLS